LKQHLGSVGFGDVFCVEKPPNPIKMAMKIIKIGLSNSLQYNEALKILDAELLVIKN
jgi:hypothetical protein